MARKRKPASKPEDQENQPPADDQQQPPAEAGDPGQDDQPDAGDPAAEAADKSAPLQAKLQALSSKADQLAQDNARLEKELVAKRKQLDELQTSHAASVERLASEKAARAIEAAFDDLPGDRAVVVAKRFWKRGDVTLQVGDPIAQIRMLPGLTLNVLVDLVRNGFAGDKPPKRS